MARPPEAARKKIDTGQWLRQPIEWRLDTIIDQIRVEGTGVVSVAYLDIDGYGQIEEEHGYGIADALLEAIPPILRSHANVDFADRFVRDSFLIIYNGLVLEDAFLAAEQLRSELSGTPFPVSSGGERAEIQVTFSAGVATYPGDSEGRHELISLAEEGALRAHESGGKRTAIGRSANMIPKTSHYLPAQLERLRLLGNQMTRSDASLLREALDDLLRKYDQRDSRRGLARMFGWVSGKGADDAGSEQGKRER